MKILFLIGSLGLGGAEEQVLNLAKEYVEFGHEVMILTLTDASPRVAENYGFRISQCRGSITVIGVLRIISNLVKVLREFRPDVFHSHLYHANIISRLVTLLHVSSAALINTSHSSNEGGAMRMLGYRWTSSIPSLWTNVSESAVDRFEKIGAAPVGKMCVVHNGIDLDNFKPSPDMRDVIRGHLGLRESDFVFIAVGRLVYAKNYPMLIRAFAAVRRTRSDAMLLIVGDGDLKAEILDIVKEEAVTDSVMLLGARLDVPYLLNVADSFVSTSLWEGFGISVAEAMAMELPVIVTDSGGVRDVVGEDFSLVESGDVDRFTVSMMEVMQMAEPERLKLGLLLRSRIEDLFSLPAIANQWLSLYRRAIS